MISMTQVGPGEGREGVGAVRSTGLLRVTHQAVMDNLPIVSLFPKPCFAPSCTRPDIMPDPLGSAADPVAVVPESVAMAADEVAVVAVIDGIVSSAAFQSGMQNRQVPAPGARI